jgi:hypothetical protein
MQAVICSSWHRTENAISTVEMSANFGGCTRNYLRRTHWPGVAQSYFFDLPEYFVDFSVIASRGVCGIDDLPQNQSYRFRLVAICSASMSVTSLCRTDHAASEGAWTNQKGNHFE